MLSRVSLLGDKRPVNNLYIQTTVMALLMLNFLQCFIMLATVHVYQRAKTKQRNLHECSNTNIFNYLLKRLFSRVQLKKIPQCSVV